MATEEVTAQIADGSAVITFPYDFGDSMEDAVEKFGGDIVWAYAKRALVIAAQGHARSLIKGEKSRDEILTAMAEWKPGAPRQAKTAEDRAREILSKISPEERARLLESLNATPAADPAPASKAEKKSKAA